MKFLSLEQSPVSLTDRDRLVPFLAKYPQELSGYTFPTLVAWAETYSYAWSLAGDALITSYTLEPDPNRHLLQPVGRLTPELTDRLVREARGLPYPLKIINVTDRFLEENPGLVAHFDVAEDRAMANYVYRASGLADLRGSKYSKKRNLLAQASSLYSWTVEPLTAERAPACLDLVEPEDEPAPNGWTQPAPGTGGVPAQTLAAPTGTVLTREQMLREEVKALEFTLHHFGELGQEGVLVSVDGKPEAFSIWEPLTRDTAVIHFERALRSRKGLYQVINKATAEAIVARGFELVNREEDIDDPGLRQAKSSYHPLHLARAWTLTFRRS
jgi:hypothetical protein